MPSENEIRDINLFGDIKSIKQMAFDAAHPIGETYVQYPQQDDPMTIYNKNGVTSVWEEQLQYNGAFFRSGNALSTVWKVDDEDGYYTINGDTVTPVKVVADNGGTITIGSATASAPRTIDGKTYKEYSVNGYSNAAAGYINKTNLLSIQEDTTAVNGLKTTSSSDGTGTDDETEKAGNWSFDIARGAYGNTIVWAKDNTSVGSGTTKDIDITNDATSRATHRVSSPSHSHKVYLSGDDETRPTNYTINIWKRIS